MSYFTGQKLQEKIKGFGLETLHSRLEQVALGQVNWGSDLTITPGLPEDLEALRTVIYSILHDLLIKGDFVVRLQGRSLILSAKTGRKTDMGVYGVALSPDGDGQTRRPVQFGDPSFERPEDLFLAPDPADPSDPSEHGTEEK